MGGYKFYWVGCKKGLAGVGVMVAQNWVYKVVDVLRVSEKMMVLRLSVGKTVVNIVSIYASEAGRLPEEKEEFYICLNRVLSGIKELETVFIAGDFNGHVGELVEGFEGVHGGKGYGDRNFESKLLLEFCRIKMIDNR